MDDEKKYPLVSVIIRTCQKPNVLRIALESIRAQTYRNVQVVVIEDGESASQRIVENEYSDLNISYYATGERIGRSNAGNKGMELADGEYINFLDEDDGFFGNHLQTLVDSIAKDGRCLAAYSKAEERKVKLDSKTGAIVVKKTGIRYKQGYNKLLLCVENYIPIQCILFSKKLFTELGGFDSSLDCFEDWDLWVRYSCKTDFIFVDEVTSYYTVPYKYKDYSKRSLAMRNAEKKARNKFSEYEVHLNVGDINRELWTILREYKTNQLVRYMRIVYEIIMGGKR